MLDLLEQPEAPPAGSPRDHDALFYDILAGGAKTRLLEAFLDLQVPEILGSRGEMTARDFCRQLAVHPHRGWKFLHLLATVGLLEQAAGDHGEDDAVFRLSPAAKYHFGEDGRQGYYYRDLVNFWRNVAVLPIVEVLRGMPLPNAVRWPPPGLNEAEHLETWMRVTAEGAVATVLNSGALAEGSRLLDVGGGDGTIGCALAQHYPGLKVTVFNLPASAYLARRTISEKGCGDRVQVHEGDFLQDEFPAGYDRVLFSRVLCDWTPAVCRMLFEKSRRALGPGGRLVINEALVDGNLDYTVSWEFRYLFYDTFGRCLFKPLHVYRELLNDAGFEIVNYTPMPPAVFYSVIEAVPK